MSDVAERPRLVGISPRAYEHPADRAATASLATIPYLDQIVRKLIELGYERAMRTALLGNSVRLGQDQLPRVWALHHEAFHVLDVEPLPDLYLTQVPVANAAAVGAGKPFVIVNSETVTLLDESGLRAVFGHEAGHVLSDHVMYRTALIILLTVTPLGGPLLALPFAAVRMALLEWFRAAELSCDRAAALATRDPEAVCRTLMILAAGAEADQLDLGQFMAQAQDFETGGTGVEKLSRMFLDLNLTHPLPVRRAQQLMAWVQSGDYDRIVSGDYMRRGDEPPARAEAGEAAAHYADRFRSAFREAGDAVGSATDQLADWLRRDRGGDGGW